MFNSKLVAALSLLAAALASPILEARSCKPNFQGQSITIYKTISGDSSNIYEWTAVDAVGGHITLVKTPASQANGEFLVEFTGLSDNTYHLGFVTISSLCLKALLKFQLQD